MPSQPKAHVSEAIVRLRLWVSIAGLVVVFAAGAQVLTFAFIHYTDVTLSELEPAVTSQNLSVVGGLQASDVSVSVDAESLSRGGRGISSEQRSEALNAAREVNLVQTSAGVMLDNASGLFSAAGSVAVVSLMLLVMLGVVVAGGASVPGVGSAVSAFTWSTVVMGVALPWTRVMPAIPIDGVFGSYEAIAAASSVSYHGSELGVIMRYVVLPICVIAAAAFSVFSFRAGVERGVIVTTVSELDDAVEREIATLRDKGITAQSGRTVGALNRAIGEGAEEPLVGAARGRPDSGPRIGQMTKGEGLGRPI